MYTVDAVDENGNEQTIYTPAIADGKFALSDAKINYEINKAGSFTFTMQPTHYAYSSLKKLQTIIKIRDDLDTIWMGRILDEQIDFYGAKTMTCEGIMSTLNDALFYPTNYSNGVTVYDFLNSISSKYYALYSVLNNGRIMRTNFSESLKNKTYYGDLTSYENCMNVFLNTIVEQFGLYATVTYDNHYVNNACLNVYDTPEHLEGQTIEFGRNLLDLTRHIDASQIYTYLVPTGKDGLKISSVSTGGVDYVYSASAEALFGKIYRHAEFSDIESATELLNAANEELLKNISEATTIELSAVDLHLLDVDVSRIEVGKLIRVISRPHGIDEDFLCSKITLDLLDPSRSSYSFGMPQSGITDIVVSK